MNIAIILPCLSEGGAERIGGMLSQCLSEKMNVFIFLFHHKITYEYGGEIIDLNFDEINNKYHRLGEIGKIISLPLKYIKFVKKIRKMKEKYKIQCSISFLERPNILNILSRKKDKVIVSVRSLRSSRKYTFYELIENILIKLIYNRSNKIISISEGVRLDLIDNFGIYPDKVKTIYNFLDIETIKAKANEKVESDLEVQLLNNKVIITVGRLHPIKNQERLINDFAQVKMKINNLKLIIIGSGPEEKNLKNKAKDLNIDTDVIFIDYNNNPFKYIKRADLFVLCSKSEGYGNVILEAMTCGTPVISTDCPTGPREILLKEPFKNQHIQQFQICDYGILIPNDESGECFSPLSKAIILMLTDSDLSKQIRKRASKYIESYSINKIKKEWIQEIENICDITH